jgi:ABC-2 type transport system permease protein
MSASPVPYDGRPVRLSRRIDPPAVAALFGLTVGRLIRGRRLVVLSMLYALPIVIAMLAYHYNPDFDTGKAELALVFGLIPQAILPLTALVFASGMIQDEVEEQTLTYLLVRPLPRPMIYATKLAATWTVMAAITAVFVLTTYGVLYSINPAPFEDLMPGRPLKAVAIMLLALAAYGSVFGLVGLFVRRTLLFGVPYIVVLEGVFANIEFVIRHATIMYQSRVLTIRWLGLEAEDWNIDLTQAPSLEWSALNLVIATTVLTLVGAFVFAHREYRVKTPEAT